jgi:acyl-CoA thioester hydrolase
MEQTHASRKEVHRCLVPIRWGDMDVYGHVNNTIYFRYMEQVRVEYLESLGYPIVPKGTAPVIVNASCTFLIPLTYPGTVEVRMFLGTPGRSSIPSNYEIRLVDDEATVYATGEAKIVWTDMTTGKSVPIPDDLRERPSGLRP